MAALDALTIFEKKNGPSVYQNIDAGILWREMDPAQPVLAIFTIFSPCTGLRFRNSFSMLYQLRGNNRFKQDDYRGKIFR